MSDETLRCNRRCVFGDIQTELQICIFVLAVSSSDSLDCRKSDFGRTDARVRQLLTISSVCKAWRALAEGCNALWDACRVEALYLNDMPPLTTMWMQMKSDERWNIDTVHSRLTFLGVSPKLGRVAQRLRRQPACLRHSVEVDCSLCPPFGVSARAPPGLLGRFLPVMHSSRVTPCIPVCIHCMTRTTLPEYVLVGGARQGWVVCAECWETYGVSRLRGGVLDILTGGRFGGQVDLVFGRDVIRDAIASYTNDWHGIGVDANSHIVLECGIRIVPKEFGDESLLKTQLRAAMDRKFGPPSGFVLERNEKAGEQWAPSTSRPYGWTNDASFSGTEHVIARMPKRVRDDPYLWKHAYGHFSALMAKTPFRGEEGHATMAVSSGTIYGHAQPVPDPKKQWGFLAFVEDASLIPGEKRPICFYTKEMHLATQVDSRHIAAAPEMYSPGRIVPVVPHRIAHNVHRDDLGPSTWPPVSNKIAFGPALASRILVALETNKDAVDSALSYLTAADKRCSVLRHVRKEFFSDHPVWIWAVAYAQMWMDCHERRLRQSRHKHDFGVDVDRIMKQHRQSTPGRAAVIHKLFFDTRPAFQKIVRDSATGRVRSIPSLEGSISEVVPWIRDGRVNGVSRDCLYQLHRRIRATKVRALRCVAGALGTTLERSGHRLRLCNVCKLVAECPLTTGYWFTPSAAGWGVIKRHRHGCCIAASDVTFVPLPVAARRGKNNGPESRCVAAVASQFKKRPRLPLDLSVPNKHLLASLSLPSSEKKRRLAQSRCMAKGTPHDAAA